MKNYAALLVLLIAAPLAARAQTISVSPATVKFAWQIGATLPAAQSVGLRLTGGTGSLSYQVSIPASDEWLTATPGTGTVPCTLSLRVNPNGMSAGTWTSTVTVTVTGISTPVTINVTLVVSLASSGLTLSENTVAMSAPPFTGSASIQLSTASLPVSFTAASATSWLSVSPAAGVALPGAPATLTVSLNAAAANLTPQSTPYAGKVTIIGSGSGSTTKSQTLIVNLTVSNTVPTITGIWPGTIPVGSAATTITIFGTSFYSATTVKVTGSPTALTPTVFDQKTMDVTLPATLLATEGTLSVTVSNPAPGGDSNSMNVAVDNAPWIGAVMNTASFDATAISPGELIAIFGTNLGPAPTNPPPPLDANGDGFVDTSVDGVSVTVGGVAAPLIFISPTQVNAQVPYEASLGASTVVVAYGAGAPATFPVTIAATDPGIFTADGTGTGPVAAINVAATTNAITLNAEASPAHAKDIVEIYLTGEGSYVPASVIPEQTGYLVPETLTPLPQMSPLPTVAIDGLPATVDYAGPVPSCIMGIFQINVTVPAVTTTGAVPVVVTIGSSPGTSTQAGTTLYVHP